MKRVLVLGASGAIGAAVVNEAVSAGWLVSAGLRNPASCRRPLPGSVRVSVCDLSRPEQVRSLVDAVAPDLVVMAAHTPGHPSTADERRRHLIDNLTIHLSVAEAMAGLGARCRLVSLGSSMVYGEQNDTRDPRGAMTPPTFRGAIKAAESVTVGAMARLHRFGCTELRVFCAYGPWMSHERVLTRLLTAALTSSRVPLALAPLPRDWVHHDDVARACLLASEVGTAEPTVFNLCSGRLRDVREVARLLESITGRTLIADELYPGPDRMGVVRPGMPPAVEQDFRWQPRVELEAGLEGCWRWAQTAAGRHYLLAKAV